MEAVQPWSSQAVNIVLVNILLVTITYPLLQPKALLNILLPVYLTQTCSTLLFYLT